MEENIDMEEKKDKAEEKAQAEKAAEEKPEAAPENGAASDAAKAPEGEIADGCCGEECASPAGEGHGGECRGHEGGCHEHGGECHEHGREGREHEHGHCRRELEKVREELSAMKAEAEDFKRKWYAVTAEYENYRRRTQNQSSQRYTEGRNDVVAELFPVGDNLERALAACADDKTKEGLEMVLKSYRKVLESEGIEELDPTGQPFDSAVAEAIMAVPAGEGEEAGIVRHVYVKGYKRGEKVLRYAQVIVTR